MAINTRASAPLASRAYSRSNKPRGRRSPRRQPSHAVTGAQLHDFPASARAVVSHTQTRPVTSCGNFSWFGAYWRNGRRSSDHRCRRARSFAQRSLSLGSFAFRPSPRSLRNVFRDKARSRRRRREGAQTTDRRLEGDLTRFLNGGASRFGRSAALSASSIQTGAWSLAFSQPRTSRSTPAA